MVEKRGFFLMGIFGVERSDCEINQTDERDSLEELDCQSIKVVSNDLSAKKKVLCCLRTFFSFCLDVKFVNNVKIYLLVLEYYSYFESTLQKVWEALIKF